MFEKISLVIGSFYATIDLKWNETFNRKEILFIQILFEKIYPELYLLLGPVFWNKVTKDSAVVSLSVVVSIVLCVISLTQMPSSEIT
jgi:hypothetical protein